MRRGFTVMETLVSLGLLTAVLVLVAQVAVWGIGERRRADARQDALEAAANLLESARAAPWESLTDDWAAAQRLPEPLTERLSGWKLTVRVEPEAPRSLVKRVSIEVTWTHDDGSPARPVRLVGLFAARSAQASGGKP